MGRIRAMCAGLAMLGLAPLSALADPAGCPAQPIASLPMILLSGKALVFIQVNGQAATFAIDTGGFASAVSEKLVERLKLPTFPIRNYMALRDIGGERATKYAKVDSIQLGALKGGSEQFMVGDLGPGIDGFIAPDYLQNFDLDFDFPGGVLNLYRPRSCTDHPPGAGEFSGVEMDVGKDGHIRIPVMLDGKRLWAEIDTGAGSTFITAAQARSDFGVRMGDQRTTVRGAAGGALQAEPHVFDSLSIGTFAQERPRLGVLDKDDGFYQSAPILLGMAQMRSLRLYVSYRDRRLYASRPAGLSRPGATASAAPAPDEAVLGPVDAIARAAKGQAEAARFRFTVRSTGQSDAVLYLDSETNYRDSANLAVDVPQAMLAGLGQSLGGDVKTAIVGRQITVTGVPRQVAIRVRNPDGTDGRYFQTHIRLGSLDQLAVAP